MPVTGDSALGQFEDVIPTTDTAPLVPTHLQGIVDAIEKHAVLWVPTSSGGVYTQANVNASFAAFFTAPDPDVTQEPGMLGVILAGACAGLYFRPAGGDWVRLYGTDLIKIGTVTPTASDVPEGGIYIKVDN